MLTTFHQLFLTFYRPYIHILRNTQHLHNVSLTEGQISTILYILEGYNPLDSNGYDPECREDIDKIFEELEGVVDTYYNNKGD